jgi:SAM-dependent methyltransferase
VDAPERQTTETTQLYDGFSSGARSDQHWNTYVELARHRLTRQLRLAFPDRPCSMLRFLDIGCGGGHLVEAAIRLKFQEAVGTEMDRAAVASARAKGLNVFAGSWPVAELENQRFDFISMMHVLEHMPNPGEILLRCLACLNQGGVLAIDVPDQGSLPSVLKRSLRILGRRMKEYGYVQPPWHVFGFRKRSFEVFADLHGLKFVWIRRTSPLDKSFFPHTDDYWSGRFKWNRRTYQMARLLGRGGHLSIGLCVRTVKR